jgi:hypothetical protein
MTGFADPSDGPDWFQFHKDLVEIDSRWEGDVRPWLLRQAESTVRRKLTWQQVEYLVSLDLNPGDVFVVLPEAEFGRSVGFLGHLEEFEEPAVDWDSAP